MPGKRETASRKHESPMELSREGNRSLFYVDVTGRSTLVCPSCHKKKVLNATPFKDAEAPLRVNCTCGQVFHASFEYRKNYIKKVDLDGVCKDPGTGARTSVHISRMSIEGLEFTADEPDLVSYGKSLTLSFTLDNAQKTPVERTIKVTSLKGDVAGAMFVGGVRNKTVGFYLMP